MKSKWDIKNRLLIRYHQIQWSVKKYKSKHLQMNYAEDTLFCILIFFFGLVGVCFEMATSNENIVPIDLFYTFMVGTSLAYVPFVMFEEVSLYRHLEKNITTKIKQGSNTFNIRAYTNGMFLSIGAIVIIAAFANYRKEIAMQIAFVVIGFLIVCAMYFSVLNIVKSRKAIFENFDINE